MNHRGREKKDPGALAPRSSLDLVLYQMQAGFVQMADKGNRIQELKALSLGRRSGV
jgi:hypothetical protein